VISNDRKIYNIDCKWPGSTHDARVWNNSEAKTHIEEQDRFLVAGDTAYPISPQLMKPYSNQETLPENDPTGRKRVFNSRLSGIREEAIYYNCPTFVFNSKNSFRAVITRDAPDIRPDNPAFFASRYPAGYRTSG
jgi:hypothetical protein